MTRATVPGGMFMLWRRRARDGTLRPVSATRMRFMVVFESSSWFLHEVGTGQPVDSYASREEAVRTARHLAELTRAEILVMNPDGTLSSREDHGLRRTA